MSGLSLAARGDMAERIREYDWGSTSLGPIGGWPQSLRTTVDLMLASPGPVSILWGPDRVQFYNDAYVPIAAERHPKALGRSAAENWSEAYDQFLGPIFDRVFAGETVSVDGHAVSLRRPDGVAEDRFFTGAFQPVRIESGEVGGVYHSLTEVTAQVRADAKLREREARLARVLDGMAEGFGLLAPDFTILEQNLEALRLDGRSREEIVGRSHWEAYPGSEKSELGQLYKRAIADRAPVSLEHRQTYEDGRRRWLDMRAYPTAEGTLAVFWRDVTDRKDAEAALRAERDRNAEILESISDAFYAVDRDWRFTYVNRKAEEWWGRCRQDLIGRVYWDEFPQAVGSAPYKAHLRAAETRDVVRLEAVSPILGHWVDISIYPTADGGLSVYFRDITEKRETAERLRESEGRYRTLFEAIDAGFCVVEVLFDGDRPTDYRFLEANPAFEKQTGLQAPVGRTARELVPDLEPHWFEIYGRVARTGESVRFENGSDAMSRWFDVHALRIGAPSERRVAILFTDVTERRRAQEQLRELNETLERRVTETLAERKLLADLVENTDAFVQVADRSFRWLGINKAAADEFERIYGVRPRVGDSMLDILADRPEHQAAVRAVWDRALAGEAFTETAEFGDPGLERRSYEMKYHVLRDADGGIAGAYQFVYDVTERAQEQQRLAEAEEARREADALYRAYFENTPEALFVIRVEPEDRFVVEELNPAHQAGVGMKLEDVKGKRIEEVLPPAVAEQVVTVYRRVLDTGQLYQFREVYDLDGVPRHWDTSLFPVRDEAGRITRLIGSSRDVTRQVMAEEALRQAQKMEAVGQLTGGIAHDFNNLLGAVVGSLDLIRRKPADVDRVRRYADAGLQAAERGAKLTGQLLAFSRAQRLEQKPVVVSALLQGMRDMLDRSLGPLVRLKLEIEGDGAALSDPTQLEMAVLNLAINARDAMPEGGELTIATTPRDICDDPELQQGEYVEISVADTGTGMTPEVAARAFDPFFTTKGVGKGTGLGLSQVYGLARQTGGTARIDSRPGHGATVRILLPKTNLLPRTEALARADEHAKPGPPATILVVDDDPDIRRVLVDSLEALEYRVLEAADGHAGLTELERASPDLMMIDFAMPGMNGAEVAKAARERRAELPIIFASGYADTDAIETAAGRDVVVLRKPFRVDELQAVLTAALGGRSSPEGDQGS